MANWILSAIRRREQALLRPEVLPPAPPLHALPFTDADFYHARLARESYDRLERTRRWAVTVTPPDHCARRFYMTGDIESVARRARHVFADLPCLVLLEPAAPDGAETAMLDVFQESGGWPTTDVGSGYTPQTGRYSNVVVDGNGNVVITYTQNAPQPLVGTLLYMTPYLGPDGQTVAWQCGTAPAPLFNGVAGTLLSTSAGVSNVPVAYLPKACHP